MPINTIFLTLQEGRDRSGEGFITTSTDSFIKISDTEIQSIENKNVYSLKDPTSFVKPRTVKILDGNILTDAELNTLKGKPTTATRVKPEDLKVNVRSSIDGLVDIEKQDSDIPKIDEYTFMKITGHPGKTNGFAVEDGILRVRIGGSTDFADRPGGVTYISMKVPDNFNETLFLKN